MPTPENDLTTPKSIVGNQTGTVYSGPASGTENLSRLMIQNGTFDEQQFWEGVLINLHTTPEVGVMFTMQGYNFIITAVQRTTAHLRHEDGSTQTYVLNVDILEEP